MVTTSKKYFLFFIVPLFAVALFAISFSTAERVQIKSFHDKIYADLGVQISLLQSAVAPIARRIDDVTSFSSDDATDIRSLALASTFLPGVGCVVVSLRDQVMFLPSATVCTSYDNSYEKLTLNDFFGPSTALEITVDLALADVERLSIQRSSAILATAVAFLMILLAYGLLKYFYVSEAEKIRKEVYNSPLGILKIKVDGTITECNRAFASVVELSTRSIIGENIDNFLDKADIKKLMTAIRHESTNSDQPFHIGEVSLKTSTKLSFFDVSIRSSTDGGRKLFSMTFSDVTHIISERNLKTNLLRTDELTGLSSRYALSSDLENFRRQNDMLCVLIDVDFFKSINVHYGTEIGDQFLCSVAAALTASKSKYSTIYRLGGAKFLIIEDIVESVDTQHDFVLLHKRSDTLRQRCSKVELVLPNDFSIKRSASAGAIILTPDMSLGDVLSLCDVALSRARKVGSNQCISIFDNDEISGLDPHHQVTLDQIERALEAGDITLYLQPLCDIKNKEVYGYETLIRWEKDGNVISPAVFLESYYKAINAFDVNKPRFDIFTKLLENMKDGFAKRVSFNIQADDIVDGKHKKLISELHAYTSDFDIVLEISENIFAHQVEEKQLREIMHELKSSEFILALDDFGVSGSNLQRLLELPIDVVKLDKYFADKIDSGDAPASVVRAIQSLCNDMNIKTVIEGIETRHQRERFFDLGVEIHQGYFLSKPLPYQQLKGYSYSDVAV